VIAKPHDECRPDHAGRVLSSSQQVIGSRTG
jgi:hypothetical protein